MGPRNAYNESSNLRTFKFDFKDGTSDNMTNLFNPVVRKGWQIDWNARCRLHGECLSNFPLRISLKFLYSFDIFFALKSFRLRKCESVWRNKNRIFELTVRPNAVPDLHHPFKVKNSLKIRCVMYRRMQMWIRVAVLIRFDDE